MEVNLTKLKYAMVNQMQLNEAIANNLANLGTTGFKRDQLFFESLSDEMKPEQTSLQAVDFSQGSIKETQNPLDLAISGRGFFAVETPNGRAYTREGHFKLDENGVLKNSMGQPVLGEGGLITLIGEDLDPKEIRVTMDGEIYVDEEFVDRLMIRDFENPESMDKMGNNLYLAGDSTIENNEAVGEVQQGFLEEANVNPAEEMIQLIEVQRQFESIQRMVRSLDEVLRQAANQVGKY